MKMKDFLFWAMMLLVVPLCACSDSENEVPEPEKPVATTMKLIVKLTLPEDYFKVADVYLGYIDANGKHVSEKLVSPSVSKEISASVSKVKELGACVVLQSKALESHEVEYYKLGEGSKLLTWQVLDQNGELMDHADPPVVSSSYAVPIDKLEEHLAEKKMFLDKSYKVTPEGKLEATTVDWGFNFL